MKVYTSYFANIRNIPSDFSLFSIAGKTPDGFPGKKLQQLAPKYQWWKEWKNRFLDRLDSKESIEFYSKMYFDTVLSNIDVDKLRSVFSESGKTPCLFCYERPEKFCHRHLLADYLNKNGFTVKEYKK